MSKKFSKRIYASQAGKVHLQADDLRIPSTMLLEGQLDFQAAKDDGGDTTPKFYLIANSGTPMELNGFYYPVIIAMEGAKFGRKVSPVIADHDVSKRIGHTTRQAAIPAGRSKNIAGEMRQGPLIAAEGVVSSKMGIAQGFVEDAKAGFPFQVSVGADIIEAQFVDEGEKVEVNGKKFKGPLIVAEKTLLREFTITVLGADGNTEATIAARHSQHKEITMNPFKDWIEAMGLDFSTLNDDQKTKLEAQFKAINTPPSPPAEPTLPEPKLQPITAGAATPDFDKMFADHTARVADAHIRMDKINACFSDHHDVEKVTFKGKEINASQFKDLALRDNTVTIDEVELTLLKASFPSGSSGPAIHMAPTISEVPQEAIAAALCRQLGVKASATHQESGEKWGIEHWYDERALEASRHRDLQNITLHQMMDMAIHASGSSYSGNRKSDDFIRAAREAMLKIQASGPSSLNVSNIFDDVANKSLLAAYNGVNTTWQEICAVKNVTDFKAHNLYRLNQHGSYHIVGVDGQLEHGTFTDEKYSVTADTYGKITGLDRKHLINDDMDAFNTIMSSLGAEGAKALEELVYVTFLGALTTLYPTAGTNNNYISGAGSDLTIGGLTVAATKFSNQVDADQSPIMINADRILVGTQDEIFAGQLYNESAIRPVGSTQDERFINNPHAGGFRPIVSPYLNNALIKQRVDLENLGEAITGQSSDQWFMFAPPSVPQGASLYVALLGGRRVPYLERADAPFDVLGLRWRAYHDFGVALGDPKLSLMSKGAA